MIAAEERLIAEEPYAYASKSVSVKEEEIREMCQVWIEKAQKRINEEFENVKK